MNRTHDYIQISLSSRPGFCSHIDEINVNTPRHHLPVPGGGEKLGHSLETLANRNLASNIQAQLPLKVVPSTKSYV